MLMQAEGHTMLLLQSKHNASLERERERERDDMQKEMRGVKQEDILWQGRGREAMIGVLKLCVPIRLTPHPHQS